MDKDTADKIEGMMIVSRAHLESLADPVGQVYPSGERRAILLKIGAALLEVVDVSTSIYESYPELNPFRIEDGIAASMQADRVPSDDAKSRYLET